MGGLAGGTCKGSLPGALAEGACWCTSLLQVSCASLPCKSPWLVSLASPPCRPPLQKVWCGAGRPGGPFLGAEDLSKAVPPGGWPGGLRHLGPVVGWPRTSRRPAPKCRSPRVPRRPVPVGGVVVVLSSGVGTTQFRKGAVADWDCGLLGSTTPRSALVCVPAGRSECRGDRKGPCNPEAGPARALRIWSCRSVPVPPPAQLAGCLAGTSQAG